MRSLMSRYLLAALLLLPLPARGHDYWLEPDSFTPTPGKPVALHLHVGDGFVTEGGRPFQKKPTLRFHLVSAAGTKDLAGDEDKSPYARLTLDTPAAHLVRLDRDSRLIKLEAKKFNDYLKDEGLDDVLAARKTLGEADKPGRERYSRFIKLVVGKGTKGDATVTTPLGQKLELVPLANPTTLKVDDQLPVRVLLDGKPLAGVQVMRHHRVKDKVTTKTERTNAKGDVSFALDKAGPYLVRLVHMRRVEKDADADWESFWAALTFAVE